MENEEEAIREVMRMLGSRRTPAKAEANRQKLPRAVAASQTPEARQKRSQAQKARREREKAAQTRGTAESESAAHLLSAITPSVQPSTMTTPKRPRGRPRKQEKGEVDAG